MSQLRDADTDALVRHEDVEQAVNGYRYNDEDQDEDVLDERVLFRRLSVSEGDHKSYDDYRAPPPPFLQIVICFKGAIGLFQ